MSNFGRGDVVQMREGLGMKDAGKVVVLLRKPYIDTWEVEYLEERGKKPFNVHVTNLERIPVPQPGDRVQVRAVLGANGGREGTVIQQAPSGALVVELDGSVDDCYFNSYQLKIIDKAPVKVEPKAEAVNALLKEIGEDAKRLQDSAIDILDYGMKDTAKELDAAAHTLLKFQNKLYHALRKDGIYLEQD